MNVLLIEPPFYSLQEIKSGKASLGLAMLAGAIKEKGWEVSIYSPDLEFDNQAKSSEGVTTHIDHGYFAYIKERLKFLLLKNKPDVVGISAWTARYNAGLRIARVIREICGTEIKIVMGGIHATMFPEETLGNMDIDYIIVGEGEGAFIELLEHLKWRSLTFSNGIRNLYYRDKNGAIRNTGSAFIENLDSLPMPAYDKYLNYQKIDPNIFGSILSARGCPFLCTYCASNIIWSRKVRFHSPKYIFGLLEYIYQNFGTRIFRFNDDTFNLNRNRLFQICRLLKDADLPIEWEADIRGDLADYETLNVMRDAGCVQVNIGVETADEIILKQVRKNLDLNKVKRAFKICKEINIKTTGYFMIGFPGETEIQVNKTLSLIKELNPDNPIISIFIPYPGTEAYEMAVRDGIMDHASMDWDHFFHHSEKANYSGSISDERWKKLISKAEQLRKRIRLKNRLKNKISQTNLLDRYSTKGFSCFLNDIKSFSILIRQFRK
ncbi:radical SAM protein [Candidatus Parcubacteria bacterium]|nr:MAG: radical SAM protein [Candidatus Parcubacteria bacterium]